MALATDTMKTALLNAYKAQGSWLSLHTGAPGSTGANESTGGSPAYSRQQTTWGTPSSGTLTGSQVNIPVPASTITAAGVWTAATGGTFLDALTVTSTTVSGNATIQVTPTITIS